MRLIIIGSGAGMPVPDRASSCYYLEHDDDAILLDCGDGSSRAILSAKIEPLRIGAIVITHNHSDHWTGFPLLIQMYHLMLRKKTLEVFASNGTIELLRHTLEISYMWKERIGFDIHWNILKHDKAFKYGKFGIIPHRNSHLDCYKTYLDNHPLCNLDSFAIEVNAFGRRIVYSGDIGGLQDLDPIFEKHVNLLLIEGMHFPIDEFRNWLDAFDVDRAIITHIPQERREFDFGNALIAEDGMVVDIQ